LESPFLRGFLENYIDSHLAEAEVQNMKGIVDIFGLGVKSRLDAHIGFFLGCSYMELLLQFLILNNRLPNKEEMLMVFNLMKRRLPEIIREIKNVKGSSIKDTDEAVVSFAEVEVESNQPVVE
jgi:hypothetical protein